MTEERRIFGEFDAKLIRSTQFGVALKRLRKSRPRIPKTLRLRPPALDRRDVTRREFNQVIDLLHERGEIIAGLMKELEIQFKRIAQIQSELDEVRQALQRWKRTGSDGPD